MVSPSLSQGGRLITKNAYSSHVMTSHMYLQANLSPSDTTAAALSCLFVELATHPEVTKELQDELDDFFQENPEPDANALSRLKYLQACIDEALRVMPVVPSGPQRVTPPEGLEIDEDLFIPGDTIVQVPTYTLHRGTRSTMGGSQCLGPKLMRFQ